MNLILMCKFAHHVRQVKFGKYSNNKKEGDQKEMMNYHFYHQNELFSIKEKQQEQQKSVHYQETYHRQHACTERAGSFELIFMPLS